MSLEISDNSKLGRPRRPESGRHRATRNQWRMAYRLARIRRRHGCEIDCRSGGTLWWAAQLVVYDIRNRIDPLSTSAPDKLSRKRIVNGLLSEWSATGTPDSSLLAVPATSEELTSKGQEALF